MVNRFLLAAAAATVTMLAGVFTIAQGLNPGAALRPFQTEAGSASVQCGVCDAFKTNDGAPPPDSLLAAFRTGFDLWRRVCDETRAACRAAAKGSVTAQCANGAEPLTGPLKRLSDVGEEIGTLSARCQGLACPDADCSAMRTLRRTLADAQARVVQWQVERRLSTDDVDLAEAARASAQADLIQVVGLANASPDSPPSSAALTTMADQFWRHEAEMRAVAETLSGPEGDQGGPAPWRLHEIAMSLRAAGDALKEASDVTVTPPDPARRRQVQNRWSAVGNAIGAALVQLHTLDVELKAARAAIAGPGAARCAKARIPGGGLAQRLATTATSLDQCLARLNCAPPEGNGASTKAPGPRAGEGLGERADALSSALAAVRLADAGSVTLSVDDTNYVQGDAIAVRVKESQNRCLAEGGWLGLFRLDSAARIVPEPLTKVPVPAEARAEPVLIGAPLEAGDFALALFGSETARTPLGVRAIIIADPPAAKCSGFTGRWKSDFGDLTMSVRGGQLRGTYRRSADAPPGFVTGTVSGRVFKGTWRSELGAGGTRLVLAKDGASFSGTWSKKLATVDGSGPWRGRCVPGG